jgi:hypothetical protein
MTLLMMVLLAVVAVPAAIFLFGVVSTEPKESRAAFRVGLSHYGGIGFLAILVGFALMLVFSC